MIHFLAAHKIEPIVDQVFGLEEIETALQHMDSGAQFGKIVLKVGWLPWKPVTLQKIRQFGSLQWPNCRLYNMIETTTIKKQDIRKLSVAQLKDWLAAHGEQGFRACLLYTSRCV